MSEDGESADHCAECGRPAARRCEHCGRADCGEHLRWSTFTKNQFAPLLKLDGLCGPCATQRVRAAYRGFLLVLGAGTVAALAVEGELWEIPMVLLPLSILWWLTGRSHAT